MRSGRDMLAENQIRAHSWTLGQPSFLQINKVHHDMVGKKKGRVPRGPEWGRSCAATRSVTEGWGRGVVISQLHTEHKLGSWMQTFAQVLFFPRHLFVIIFKIQLKKWEIVTWFRTGLIKILVHTKTGNKHALRFLTIFHRVLGSSWKREGEELDYHKSEVLMTWSKIKSTRNVAKQEFLSSVFQPK